MDVQMQADDKLKKDQEKIRQYIEKYAIDLDESEKEYLVENLDMKTIQAFEQGLESAEEELTRPKEDTELILDYISDKNLKEDLASYSEMIENPPQGLESNQVEEILSNIEKYEDLNIIHWIDRDDKTYYFNSYLMTGQFASTAVLLKENDVLEIIASRTRRDCKTYPRPLQVSALNNPPYNYSKDQVLQAIDQMENDDKYQDIKTVEASNGGVCIYSDDHMSEKYAKALCEEIEVNWIRHQ